MVKFVNVRDAVGVTTAYFKDMPFLPRVGERVTLPETLDGLKFGYYQVVRIHFIATALDTSEGDSELMNVRIEVEPVPRPQSRRG